MKVKHRLVRIFLMIVFVCALSITSYAQDKIVGQVLTTDICAYINGERDSLVQHQRKTCGYCVRSQQLWLCDKLQQ